MQTTEVAAGTILVMAERRPDRRGLAARRAILIELRRRELADEPPPGVRELARLIGQGYTPTRHHVGYLLSGELVRVEPGRGRRPGRVTLTTAGRQAADLSTPPSVVS